MGIPIDVQAAPINGITDIARVPNDGAAIVLCDTTAQIPASAKGYRAGCLLIDKEAKKAYVNTGTNTACTFSEVGILSLGDLAALTDNTGGTTTSPDTLADPEAGGAIGSATFSVSPTQGELDDFRDLLAAIQAVNNNNIAKLAAKVNELRALIGGV
jgi:hypothetical protein